MKIGIFFLLGLMAGVDCSNSVDDLVNLTNKLVVDQEDDWECGIWGHEQVDCAQETVMESDVDGRLVPKYGSCLKEEDSMANGFRAFDLRNVVEDGAVETNVDVNRRDSVETAHGVETQCPVDVFRPVEGGANGGAPMMVEQGMGSFPLSDVEGVVGSVNRGNGIEGGDEVARNEPLDRPNWRECKLGKTIEGEGVGLVKGVGPQLVDGEHSNNIHLSESCPRSSSSVDINQKTRKGGSNIGEAYCETIDGVFDQKKRKCGGYESSLQSRKLDGFGGLRSSLKGKEVVHEVDVVAAGDGFARGKVDKAHSSSGSGGNQRRWLSIKNKARGVHRGKNGAGEANFQAVAGGHFFGSTKGEGILDTGSMVEVGISSSIDLPSLVFNARSAKFHGAAPNLMYLLPNARGIGNPWTFRALQSHVREFNLSIIFLMEIVGATVAVAAAFL
uniref:Uncharacterized protein n=1 Tax=Cannabis sativa TaxID=3483 RepID=A0A803NS35_CANSA